VNGFEAGTVCQSGQASKAEGRGYVKIVCSTTRAKTSKATTG